MKKYVLSRLSPPPEVVPENDGSKVDALSLYKAAGVEPPERPGIMRLKRPWNGHRAGAFVLYSDDAIFVFDR